MLLQGELQPETATVLSRKKEGPRVEEEGVRLQEDRAKVGRNGRDRGKGERTKIERGS